MPHLKPIYSVLGRVFRSPKPFAVIARCTLFWKLASLPCASSSALSAIDVAQRLDPRALALGEVAQHMGVHQLLHARMTDAERTRL